MTDTSLQRLSTIKRFLILAILSWSACVVLTWVMVAISVRHTLVEHAVTREARTFVKRELAFRNWATNHGGIYVPPSATTPASPYLAHIPDRDLILPSGKTLTLLNPAYMTRQLHEEFATAFGIKAHITSLSPSHPENAPSDWERRALESLANGSQEFREFTIINDEETLLLMQPMPTQKGCLKCHAQQGYKEGDILGGISIAMPLTELLAEAETHQRFWSLALLGLWLLGLIGIWFSSRRLMTEIAAKDTAYTELASIRAALEARVKARTKTVEEANAQLEEEKQERLKIQHALEKSHGELQQIFNSAGDGMRVVDWDHNMVMFNDTFVNMTGGSRQTLNSRKCHEVFPGPLCHTENCPLTRAENGEEQTSHEVTKTALDGRKIQCLTLVALFYDSEGKGMGILESFRDISTLKKLEKNLFAEASRNARQAEELLEKNTATISQNTQLEQALRELKATQSQMLQNEKMATVGQLAAGVAHEINNPTGFVTSNLASLKKYVQRLTDFLAQLQEVVSSEKEEEIAKLRKKLKIDEISDDIPDLINESLEGTERIKKIVMSLKNFSRTDQEEYGPANINDCLESTLNVVWNELKYKATVEKEYGDLPLTTCYAQLLNQVFMNLLVNSAQAIKEQGVISIKTWCDDDNIFISISDTGAGMDEETLTHIFEPFYTSKEKDKGTGLGLSIAHDIITKKHQGRLCVESQKGQGTTFIIEIPMGND